MKKMLSWVLINSIFAVCGYYGLVEGVAGAGYIFWFMFWLCTIGAIICNFSSDAIKVARRDGPSVPRWMDVVFDLGILFLVVWNHHYFAGAFYVIHMLALQNVYSGESE